MIIGFDASRAFSAGKTGTENYSFFLLKEMLDQADDDVSFRIFLRGNSSPQDCLDQLSPNRLDKIEFKIIKPDFLWTQWGLAKESWLNKCDVFFVPAHVIPLMRNPGSKFVVTVHDLALEYLPAYDNLAQKIYLGWLMEKIRSRLASHLIAVSRYTKQDIVSKLGIKEEKISVVYEGVDPSYHFPVENKQVCEVKDRYNLKRPYILFVGTIQPRKNLESLIRAFSSLLKEGLDIDLVICGKKGWSYEKTLSLPQDLDISSRVRFLGYTSSSDLPRIFAGAEVFCLPSFHEGFGLPVLESFAVGKPVVISSNSSLTEVGGDLALYCDPYSLESLQDQLRSVLSWTDSEKKDFSIKAKERAISFSWAKAAQETLEILRSVADNNLIS